MKRNKKFSILFLFFFFLFFATTLVFAADVNVDFTGNSFQTKDAAVPSFIGNFYIFGLGIAGILAVGMIIFGGVLYVTGGAAPDKKNSAKEIIMGSLWGLGLLLFSYLILKTINPELVKLNNPGGNITKEISFGSCAENKDLPYCKENQSERNAAGDCVCRPQIDKEFVCPIDMQPAKLTEIPEYNWTEENQIFNGGDQILTAAEIPPIADGVSGCPGEVKIKEGTTPFFVTEIKNDTFVVDIKAIEKTGGVGGVSFPLPPGIYRGKARPYHIKGAPGKALCLLDTIIAQTKANPQNVITINLVEKADPGKELLTCADYSKEINNESELTVKIEGAKGGQCKIGTDGCTPNALVGACPAMARCDSAMATVCNFESGGSDPTARSSTDFCQNEAGKKLTEKHQFSLGLFQINMIATDKNQLANILGTTNCAGLFDKTSGPKKLPGGWKTGYDCNFIGDDAKWKECYRALSDSAKNTKLACFLFSNGGITHWKNTANRCEVTCN